jgi:hypothetical protein
MNDLKSSSLTGRSIANETFGKLTTARDMWTYNIVAKDLGASAPLSALLYDHDSNPLLHEPPGHPNAIAASMFDDLQP